MNPFKKLCDWWRKINACETCGERPASVCGDCRECMIKAFQRAEEEIERREKQKLKQAVLEVLKEIQSPTP